MRKFPFVASQSQNSRDFRQPLDKEKGETTDTEEDTRYCKNEYTSPPVRRSSVVRY
jgi:hypothetical protein